MKSLLKNEIIRVYETYMNLGFCPSFIKENIKDIYDCYHKLKGNGMITAMVDEIYKLPNEKRRKYEKKFNNAIINLIKVKSIITLYNSYIKCAILP